MFTICFPFQEQLNQIEWEAVIVDEAHKIKVALRSELQNLNLLHIVSAAGYQHFVSY